MNLEEKQQYLIDKIVSATDKQLEEVEAKFNFIFSLPESKQDRAVELMQSGIPIADIAERLEVSA